MLLVTLNTCLVQGIAGMPAHLMLQDLFDGNHARRHGQRCEVQASYLQACVTLGRGRRGGGRRRETGQQGSKGVGVARNMRVGGARVHREMGVPRTQCLQASLS